MYIVESKCPCCGANTTVLLSSEEYLNYLIHDKVPEDYCVQSICSCCIDDGYLGITLDTEDTEYYDEEIA